jgi:hypothetical protein
MPQLQHNMWVVAARSAVLSVITGGGKWVEITTHADPLYQHLIVTAERKFGRCVWFVCNFVRRLMEAIEGTRWHEAFAGLANARTLCL